MTLFRLSTSCPRTNTCPKMQPRIRCQVGTSKQDLKPIKVNSQPGTTVEAPGFRGVVSIAIVDYLGPVGDEGMPNPAKVREGVTWSIDCEVCFTGEEGVNADELVRPSLSVTLYVPCSDTSFAPKKMWGNTFEQPIRDRLPFGYSAGIKFVKLIDPCLEADLEADQPWALVSSESYEAAGRRLTDSAIYSTFDSPHGFLPPITCSRERLPTPTLLRFLFQKTPHSFLVRKPPRTASRTTQN